MLCLMATIRELAEILGVSRGTVDRTLHNRGEVSPEIRDLVLSKAKELNFQPNRAGIMLAMRKQPRKIGALVTSVGNPFFDPLIAGMEKASADSSDFGFSIHIEKVKGFGKETHLAAIRHLVMDVKCDALVLATIDDKDVEECLSASGLPVIAVNSDISYPGKLCYVGPDPYEKGALHAGLLAMTSREKRRIIILKGSEAMKGHENIVRGFMETLESRNTDFTIEGIYSTSDDDIIAEKVVREALETHPEADTLFITTAGVAGAMKGAEGRDLMIFVSDDIPSTKEFIRSGRIKWTICQEPFRQGYEAVRKMQEWLIDGTNTGDLITQHIVKIKENIATEYIGKRWK